MRYDWIDFFFGFCVSLCLLGLAAILIVTAIELALS